MSISLSKRLFGDCKRELSLIMLNNLQHKIYKRHYISLTLYVAYASIGSYSYRSLKSFLSRPLHYRNGRVIPVRNIPLISNLGLPYGSNLNVSRQVIVTNVMIACLLTSQTQMSDRWGAAKHIFDTIFRGETPSKACTFRGDKR